MRSATLGQKSRANNSDANGEVIVIPPDGEKGVYKIWMVGYFLMLPVPLTDLPHEIAVLNQEKITRTGGLQQGYLALPPKSAATLQFVAMPRGPRKDQSVPWQTD